MSTGPTLRALVTARLTAAAEEIFALFERTIAEYEEELRLCKEKQRRQEQLETLRPRVMLPRADSQTDPQSPGPDLNQEIPETPPIKEEQEFKRVKREKDRRPESVPESSPVSVKKEESSLLQQTELRDEARDEDISVQLHRWKQKLLQTTTTTPQSGPEALLHITLYIGTKYSGVVKVPPHQLSKKGVQDHLEAAVLRLRPLNAPSLSVSSRTDTGVHALCNSAHFDLQRKNKPPFTEEILREALNFHLREQSIRINHAVRVPSHFHSRYQAQSRTYVYRVALGPDKAQIPLSEAELCWNLGTT
uniref:tRNA pseudouridine synthase n=1 Tax=Knipowitschia caucasica TaxID=637954 RepID=A0AAV2M4U3_KNICA